MTMSRGTRMVLAGGLYVVVFLLTTAVGSMGYFHYGKPENTCASCHEMTGAHSSWTSSAHGTLHCRDCHGGSLTLDTHALKAHVNRVVRHFTRAPAETIRLKEDDVLRVNASCRVCHPQAFAEWSAGGHSSSYAHFFLDPTHNRAERLASDCLRCHGMFFDGKIEDLVSPISVAGPWSLKEPSNAAQPAIPCLACHQVHAAAAGVRPLNLYVRRELSYLPVGLLPPVSVTQGERPVRVSSDPRQRLCVQCHAPSAFRHRGTGDDRTPVGVHEGLSCLDCHTGHSNSAKASCASCHPASSHCGINVERMDTSFLSLTSGHNIHSVACGDCHNGARPSKL
jgi:hypothetical protein